MDALNRRCEHCDAEMNLANGAVLLEGDQAWHGGGNATLSRRMGGDPLLQLLQKLFQDDARSTLYPGLLLARRVSLAIKAAGRRSRVDTSSGIEGPSGRLTQSYRFA